jgi:hypothetical protein
MIRRRTRGVDAGTTTCAAGGFTFVSSCRSGLVTHRPRIGRKQSAPPHTTHSQPLWCVSSGVVGDAGRRRRHNPQYILTAEITPRPATAGQGSQSGAVLRPRLLHVGASHQAGGDQPTSTSRLESRDRTRSPISSSDRDHLLRGGPVQDRRAPCDGRRFPPGRRARPRGSRLRGRGLRGDPWMGITGVRHLRGTR